MIFIQNNEFAIYFQLLEALFRLVRFVPNDSSIFIIKTNKTKRQFVRIWHLENVIVWERYSSMDYPREIFHQFRRLPVQAFSD